MGALALKKIFNYSEKSDVCLADEMIPNEPDKSINIEQLTSHQNLTQSKQNIDSRELKFESHRYYVKPLLDSVNLILNDNISCLYREHFLASFNSIQAANSIPAATTKEIKEKTVLLPPLRANRKKKTLILDLDETLVHCNESLDDSCDALIDFQMEKDSVQTSINIRPFAQEFLAQMSELYEIIIFTASKGVYANSVVRKLDPEGKYITKCLFRESCVIKKKLFIKDLRIFRNRDPKDIVIVDNCCYSFIHNISNGVPIIPFYNDKSDTELKYLSQLLTSLIDLDDVRPQLSQIFNLQEYCNYDSPSELLKALY